MTDWDHEVDVVVLGSGGAGLTAALAAAANGATVAIYEKAATIGGTTAVSGGIVWIPAHRRSPEGELTEADALRYLEAQSLGVMDRELVETFVHSGPAMLDFVEQHSELQFEIAEGFPDYKPELPGGRPTGGRSLNAKPFDLARLGEWKDRITAFPADFSNVGIDAETRARIHAAVDEAGDYCVAGTALIAGLLKGLLDLGLAPRTGARAIELVAADGAIVGVRIRHGDSDIRVRARAGVVLGTGGFEWDGALVEAFLRGPMTARVTAEQHRRRPADGDGARCRPREHGRGVVGADHPDSRGHVRGQAPQPQRPTRTHASEKHHREQGGQAVPQRGGRIQLDGRAVPPSRPASRVRQRSGLDRLRRSAPQALRLSRRGARRTGSTLVPSVEGSRRAAEKTQHRPRRTGLHAGGVERERRQRAGPRLRPWVKRLRRLLGRQRRSRRRRERRSVPSRPPRITRCR